MRPLARLTAAAWIAALLLVCASSAAAAPANDNFAAAELLLGSSATATGTNVDASKETGEPNHLGYAGGHSVWFRWVAPADGTVTVSSSDSEFYSSVAAYKGLTVDGLTPVGSGATVSSVRFAAVAGETYHFAVDSPWDYTGAVVLSLTRLDGPPNDAFASPQTLTGDSATATGDTTAATREPGEPVPAGYGVGSVWYEWTAPADGGVTIDTAGSSFNTVLGVYTGDDVAGLVRVASNDDASWDRRTSRAQFTAVAGTTYRILVDGYYLYDVGQVELSLSLVPAPSNDLFANATPLPGEAAASASGYNDGAGVEPGEPAHDAAWNYGGRHSVWYSWTAPKSGSLTVKVTAAFQTVLAVYTGDSVSELTRIVNQPQDWNGGPEQIRVRVEAGVTYRIAVDSYSYSSYYAALTGEFSLGLSLIDSPKNDDFEDAEPIVGLVADVEGSTVGATQEPCEPVHDDNYYDPSVWYEWTAPASGGVTLDTAGSEFTTVLGIYTGDALCELARVPTTRTTGALAAKRRFRAVAGVTYRIAVDGARAQWGNFKLSLRYTPPPVNDMFVAALPLIGDSAKVSGDNIGATGENGEPNMGGTAGASVWYSWTAPRSGLAVIKLPTYDFDPTVSVYTGDSVDNLTQVTGSAYVSAFSAKEGTTYRIAVHGGWLPSRGEFSLTLDLIDSPANDNFADATELTGGTVSIDGTTAGATSEPGEPNHGSYYYGDFGATVWYRWTAPSSGTVTIGIACYETSQLLAAYQGDSVDTLTQVANSTYGYGISSFEAEAGVTYHIAVAGPANRQEGKFTLSLDHGSPPNDHFADAEELSGVSDSTTGSNRNASREPGEPQHYYYSYANRSVWYRWTAPEDGITTVDLTGSNFDTVHSVYTGSSIDALTSAGSADSSQLAFEAEEGVTYYIAVDGYSGSSAGSIKLSLALQKPPPNDDFADAEELSGDSVTVGGSTSGSTREPGEPDHWYSWGTSVWYRWTAPASSRTSVSLGNVYFDASFAVYTGSSVDSLTRTTGAGPQGVAWEATAGETYWIAVSGYGSGAFTLALVQDPPPEDPPLEEPPLAVLDPPLATDPQPVDDPPVEDEPDPPVDQAPDPPVEDEPDPPVDQAPDPPADPPPVNDDFADAQELTGSSATQGGATSGSTRETGEPDHWYGDGNSVWYRWTAPASSRTSVWLPYVSVDTGFAIYTGPSLGSLTRTTGNGAPGVAWVATAGETYWIAVSGYGSGDFTLELVQDPPPEDPPAETEPEAPVDTEPDPPTGQQPDPSLDQQPDPSLDQQQEQAIQQDPPSDPVPDPPSDPAQGPQSQAGPPPTGGPPAPPTGAPQPFVAPPKPSLSVVADFPPRKLASVLSSGIAGSAACSTACVMDVVVTLDPAAARKAGLRGAKLTTARVTAHGKAGVITRLKVLLPRATRAKLRRAKSVKLTVQVTARGQGETAVVTKRLTVKR